jgi:hypothetical protein
VAPLLCGVTAVGELLLWDICREGLPLLKLISTKDPRLKQIRLFWKQATHCTADMAYHQMAPILNSALEACQLSKSKVSCRKACWSGCRRVPRCCGMCTALLHAHAPVGPADHSPCCVHPAVHAPVPGHLARASGDWWRLPQLN